MTLLEQLRQETREAHEALHVHPLLAPLVSAHVTLKDYHYALLAFDAFYRRMEAQAIEPSGAPVRDWLAQDFITHGLTPLDMTAQGLTGIRLPGLDTPSKLWGYLYVKQGSTLGGNVMTKALRRNLGLQPVTQQRFFAGYGEENGAKWQLFIENLFAEAPVLSPSETIETAVACFQGIADICDAVSCLKETDALQTPSGPERKAT